MYMHNMYTLYICNHICIHKYVFMYVCTSIIWTLYTYVITYVYIYIYVYIHLTLVALKIYTWIAIKKKLFNTKHKKKNEIKKEKKADNKYFAILHIFFFSF